MDSYDQKFRDAIVLIAMKDRMTRKYFAFENARTHA